ncbi:STAS domain-containing protein [Pseudonocardia phyllosphaerae]|uniref:STAS domain-containing protein n=1 Tax=Pseudonocardia phyllosphaerae TaxID=3390502 RepID=UPI00397ADAAE
MPGPVPAPPSGDDGETSDLGVALTTPRPGITVLAVSGEVDTLTAPQLSAGLDELFRAGGDDALVVDLGGVTFLASSGLGALIHAARRAGRDDRRLHVVATARAVLRPLEVTGSDQLFTVLPRLDDVPAAGVPAADR